MVTAAAVARAAAVIGDAVAPTPLLASAWLSAQCGADVRLKLENLQPTGSFKLRGALHALATLPPPIRTRGVVAASSGNHGLGIAFAARRLGIAAEVFVPAGTSPHKQAAIADLGARVAVFGDDCVDTEGHARRVAERSGRAYVSPYNDAAVVAGQGTVAVELLEQWPDVERVYVAVGGGGLIGGMAAYAKTRSPAIEFIGCSPARSPAMAECVRQGRIVAVPCAPTLSDSTAGGVEPGAITFALCRDHVDRFVRVDEPAIGATMVSTLASGHLLVEGAAAVAIAAARADPTLRGRRAVIVVCGANVSLDRLRELLAATG